jgi:excinuclease ABC subunit C
MFDIQEELRNLPVQPGVYIMKDAAGIIIYVGKAVVLKNRVKQYFQNSSNHTPKVLAMVSKIASFEYIVTDTEVEALILECNLIKHHKPRYNILLKDDKAYPYIKITMNETYPRIMMARRIENDGAKYFGPYISNYSVHNTIETLTKVFPIKTCSRDLPRDIGKQRPCMYYHLGRCLAPCQGGVNAEEYRELMNDICALLGGKSSDIITKLEKQMESSAENLNFEKAAEIRDRIQYINSLIGKQKADIASIEDIDIIALAKNDVDTCVQVFFIRGGKILGRDHFILEGTGTDPDDEIISSFIKQFYEDVAFYPPNILIQIELSDQEVIEKWLSAKKDGRVHIRVPQRGEKHALLKMVEANAKISLGNFSIKFKGLNEKDIKVLEKFTTLAGLVELPTRIEAYDVSNTGRQENVASMIVFENGKPAKKEYRRYKIKMEEWQGDVPSMKEVLLRRFKHEDMTNPNLILVDGGIGHVNMAMEAILESGRKDLQEVKVLGMVKDDKHRTRGLIDENHKEIELKHDLDIYRFVTSIQDEAHRFAIEYNRKLRDKRYSASVLDEIPGVGKSRKKELIKGFGSLAKIRKATKEELVKIKGITEKNADNILEYFSNGEKG